MSHLEDALRYAIFTSMPKKKGWHFDDNIDLNININPFNTYGLCKLQENIAAFVHLNSRKLVFKFLENNAEDIMEIPIKKTVVWWNVYSPIDRKSFGFCTENDIIVDAPDRRWIGETLQWTKTQPEMSKTKLAMVSKIGVLQYV